MLIGPNVVLQARPDFQALAARERQKGVIIQLYYGRLPQVRASLAPRSALACVRPPSFDPIRLAA